MAFETDKQTLDDLNILGRYKSNSIFNLFNHTITPGGGRELETMFKQPLSDVSSINKRSAVFSFFENLAIALPFSAAEFDVVENYLRNPASENRLIAGISTTKHKLLSSIANRKEYVALREGLEKTIAVFLKLKERIETVSQAAIDTPYRNRAEAMRTLLNHKRLEDAWKCNTTQGLTYKQVLKFDHIFRGLLYEQNQAFLKELYALDVYIAVSNVSRKKQFVYAKAVDQQEKYIAIEGVYHPCIPGAIGNDIYIGQDKHVFFLTGANMAGKSTLMKSFGVAVYLAHMGFPVPASAMTFSLHQGMYTSINVPDNLDMGYSHFYAEVLRVKQVAQAVAADKQLVVIFDELFKGTNVKDASDGTIAIVDAFSKRSSSFIISTHIMEAGETLKMRNDHLFFKYLPTIVKGKVPTYPYILEDGITDDRQGMMIIENEKILEIINGDI